MREERFDVSEILPYEGEHVRAALRRVSGYPILSLIGRFLFPTWTSERFLEVFRSIDSVESFQDLLVGPAVKSILSQTSEGVEVVGLDTLSQSESCLFISNHRDIVLDPAIFAFYLRASGFPTVKVALGDNLLLNDWITDLIKLNKSLIVKRGVTGRAQFFALKALSQVIRDQIDKNIDSVWIAQREGRAKDGLDRTQLAVLKMLALSRDSEQSVWDVIEPLKVTPVSMSYEYDPCDIMKAVEMIERERLGDAYEKGPNADFESMLAGIQGQKGRIALTVGPRLKWEALGLSGEPKDHKDEDVLIAIKEFLDREILRGFKCFPSHAAAWMLLHPESEWPESIPKPSEDELHRFEGRLLSRMDGISSEHQAEIRTRILEQYANSVSL